MKNLKEKQKKSNNNLKSNQNEKFSRNIKKRSN